MSEELTPKPSDPAVCRVLILDLINTLESGARTRYRALAVTHLQIAANFLRDAVEQE